MARRNPDEPRIVWNRKIWREIRNMDRLKDLEYEYAQIGAAAANAAAGVGGGFLARAGNRPSRARAAVIAATIRARRTDRRDHILMGVALDAMKAHQPR
ncbi:hypothetical protein IU433_12235 [Nocardia puris]|uniref:hypothetical protein n=1 Tax=Nocardia puris TaxID=208602 RepID=UPI0018944107|nr:hypothetical protein [Nocardia puris]MBF6459805.1 hypothetical protein [Nocardia puris]